MKKFLPALFLIALMFSCSTKKNTIVTRTYHNTTSRFNILFNGKESYKTAVKKLEESYQNDYTQILPVFLYGNQPQDGGSPDANIDRTLEKTSKLITMHSITVKPELKSNKPMTASEKEFYDKNEFNKWVDDNYLLMGKAYAISGNYILAKETFRYILRQFPKEDIIYPAQIWLARTLAFNKEYRDAGAILSELEFDTKIPNNLKADLYTTLCDYNLRLKQYGKAAEYLEKVLDQNIKKKYRARYHFILAQLYLEEKAYDKTLDHFQKVVKLNPPYEMAFQAKIQSAMAYQSSAGSAGDLKSELHKMLKDDKNIEYQDQIYYALGNIEYKQNNIDKAIEYYNESTRASIDNVVQQAQTFLTLAEIYYSKQEYLLAQANYDSTVAIIDDTYPDYETIYNRSVSLTRLANHTNTFHLQDSVLRLSQLPEKELNNVIDNIIRQVIADEERARKEAVKKQEEARIAQEQQMLNNRLSIADASGAWYFYNESSKSTGIQQFKATWGNRKLEDDWRRKNKSSDAFGEFEEMSEKADSKTDSIKQSLSNKSREYYKLDIPYSDSAKELSHKQIQEALYNMGIIYSTELFDYNNAIASYEELIRRYPDCEQKLQTYYNLYLIYKELDKTILINAYKSKIQAEFPDSRIAKIISDPQYAQKILEEENRINNLYEETYTLYQQGRFAEASTNCKEAEQNFPDSPLIPNFQLIKIMSGANSQSTLELENALIEFIATYPDAQITDQAKRTLAYVKNPDKPEDVMEEVEAAEIKVDYINPMEREQHLFIFVANTNANINQLIFNIINFNLDRYSRQDFKAEYETINEKYNVAIVSSFKTKTEALNYKNAVENNAEIFRDVIKENYKPLVISSKNYRLMKEAGVPASYYQFYSNNY